MNSTPSLSSAAAASSVSMSIAVILEWLLSFVHISMTPDVQTAFATVLTAVIHYYLTMPNCLKFPLKKSDAIPSEPAPPTAS